LTFDENREEYKMLLVKGNEHLLWGPPKGHANRYERPEITAMREVREEVGLTVEIDKFTPFFTVKNMNIKIYIVMYDQKKHGKVFIDNDECVEYRWTTITEINYMKTNVVSKTIYQKWLSIIEMIDDQQKQKQQIEERKNQWIIKFHNKLRIKEQINTLIKEQQRYNEWINNMIEHLNEFITE